MICPVHITPAPLPFATVIVSQTKPDFTRNLVAEKWKDVGQKRRQKDFARPFHRLAKYLIKGPYSETGDRT